MKTNNNNLPGASSEIKCIWMTSQQVAYKLCDKEFDCENCEFDKAFRNHSAKMNEQLSEKNSAASDLLENVIKRVEEEFYDDKLVYLKNQLVIKRLFGNAYYLGINPIVLYLIEEVNSIQEFPKNDIKKNQVIFTLNGNWGKKEFISPINILIIGKISINPGKFSGNKWHSVILFNDNEVENIQLSKDDWIVEKNNILSYLKHQLKNKPGIGHSLMDGGEPVQYLYQYLGKKEFLNLLNGNFN
ncbi:MAG: hypothetical protein WCE54_24020 [Ignavibacteriaceae bacterium]